MDGEYVATFPEKGTRIGNDETFRCEDFRTGPALGCRSIPVRSRRDILSGNFLSVQVGYESITIVKVKSKAFQQKEFIIGLEGDSYV